MRGVKAALTVLDAQLVRLANVKAGGLRYLRSTLLVHNEARLIRHRCWSVTLLPFMPPTTTHALQLTLDTGQILEVALRLQTVTERQLLVDIAAAQAEGARRAEVENRTYHMGTKATAGLDYNDRLTVRIGCSSSTAYLYLNLSVHRGGLRHRRIGKKYHVTERAVREWEGEPIK